MPDVDLAYAFSLSPEKAIEYFSAKGFKIGWDWHEMLDRAHAQAFTVAKVLQEDVLKDIKKALDTALADGRTLAQFKTELIPTLKAKGWWGEIVNPDGGEVAYVTPRRLDTIYQTNLQTAYMAGRYRSMTENTANRPYWMYVAVLDGRTRPAHRALNGSVFRFSDPIWDVIYPPNGYNCRCRVRALDQAELNALVGNGEAKLQSTTGPNATGKLTDMEQPLNALGDKTTVTAFTGTGLHGERLSIAPDPGWNYNPGKYEHQLDAAAWAKAKDAPAEIRKQFVNDMARTEIRDKMFAGWVTEVVNGTRDLINQDLATMLGGKTVTAGWLDDAVLTKLVAEQVTLDTPFIVATDKQIFHAERTMKHNPVSIFDLQQLPEIIRTAEIWLDPADNSLIFVTRDQRGGLSKYVVKTNDPMKKLGQLNTFVTAQRISGEDIAAGGWKQIR